MKHYSEHILELFVCNSSEVEQEREAISRHLETCLGCRSLVEELKEFYVRAVDSQKLISAQAEDSTSLVMEARIGRRDISASYVSNSIPARLVRFAKKQPVTSSLFTLGFIVLGWYSIYSIQKKNESNPWYYEYNVKNNSLMVFDKNDTKLWEKRIKENVASILDFSASSIIYRTLTADIDNDGRKEVISILNFAFDETQSTKVRVFDGKGNAINTFTIPFQQIQYKAKQYGTEFYPTSIIFGGNSKRTLFVSNNNGRSPTVIIRYDEKGNILGSYWHYGQGTINFLDVDHDGHDELILNGINDTEDETDRSFAVTIILDPDKIVGTCESSATKGFGFSSSAAELYYIRYPIPDIIQQTVFNMGATNSTNKNDKLLRVLNRANFDQSSVAIEYFFDSTFAVKDVKFDSGMLIKHNQLFNEGKLKQPINEQYIKSLKEAVLYWNGSHWSTKPTSVLGQMSLQ
jgi:hypothetical protein